jgi:hypothetical protein
MRNEPSAPLTATNELAWTNSSPVAHGPRLDSYLASRASASSQTSRSGASAEFGFSSWLTGLFRGRDGSTRKWKSGRVVVLDPPGLPDGRDGHPRGVVPVLQLDGHGSLAEVVGRGPGDVLARRADHHVGDPVLLPDHERFVLRVRSDVVVEVAAVHKLATLLRADVRLRRVDPRQVGEEVGRRRRLAVEYEPPGEGAGGLLVVGPREPGAREQEEYGCGAEHGHLVR